MTKPLSEELRREAHVNELCGSEEWTMLLHRAANAVRAAEDFVWNVEHGNIAGFGDLRRDVAADESFRVLRASLRPPGIIQEQAPK